MRGLCGMRISKTGVARSRTPGHLCGRIFDVLHALDQPAFRTTRSTHCEPIRPAAALTSVRDASGKLAACQPSQAGTLTAKRCTAARVEWITPIVEIIPQTGLLGLLVILSSAKN